MCSTISSCGFFLRSHGISIADLSGLPRPLGGLPPGVVQKLSASGIIARQKGAGGRVYKDRAVRVIWREGNNWGRLMKWMTENDG